VEPLGSAEGEPAPSVAGSHAAQDSAKARAKKMSREWRRGSVLALWGATRIDTRGGNQVAHTLARAEGPGRDNPGPRSSPKRPRPLVAHRWADESGTVETLPHRDSVRVPRWDRVAHRLVLRRSGSAAGKGHPSRWRQGWFAPVDYSARTRYRPPPPLYQRVQRRLGPFLVGLGIGPRDVVVLEVPGRRSGLIRRTVVVQARHDGKAYLVALAGESEWARNVRAAKGNVRIGRRHRLAARLVEVPPEDRPPILLAYLLRWGRQPNSTAVRREARLFFGVSGAPSAQELAAIASQYPVFRVLYDLGSTRAGTLGM
jgi:deazaflavin-dependent oxidoreductase (nitroreductase family)